MNNPQTVDRRDVAHPTNPIGGHEHVEALRKGDGAKPRDQDIDNTRTAAEKDVKPAMPRA